MKHDFLYKNRHCNWENTFYQDKKRVSVLFCGILENFHPNLIQLSCATSSVVVSTQQEHVEENLLWRKKNLSRGNHTPKHQTYCEMGLRKNSGEAEDIDGRAIFINHLSKGLKSEVRI